MIYLSDLIKGISGAVETKFGSPPITKDLREGFDRPCTFLDVISMKTGRESLLEHSEITFELIYFAEDSHKGYLNLVNGEKALQELFSNPIKISETFCIYAEETDFEIDRDEMFVVCRFELEIFQKIDDFVDGGSSMLMDSLDIND